ncbi:hypothetical protein ADU90_10725 [Clostridium botulinum]|uniref:Membrane protein n=2 Tax=Clostridium botulinum TaxID=1491 RepID=A0A0A0IBM6_CLOBO|nr:hypothetical protein [Clostridium botulinum]KGM98864.1 membrane protein [Clostridium botulinum C/D str. DC5]KOC55544.1 hypothetical protein ADU90_10725 [Clostridium botulinum]KOC56340.1 hypothetical protein ADU89_03325 [Clostridium botulinum]MCD3233827.1 hypothetical protein [Clostridium botulinum D/C]MCD3239588.1 hypothetical protein [Clostridium botulinum D/C]
MKGYIYLILLIFMLFIIYKGFKDNIKKSPHKIKIISSFVFIIMGIRYLTLSIFFFMGNIRYLYLLKGSYFLNFIGIPLIGLITIYIVMRDYKVKFSYIFPLTIILSIIYGFIIYKYPAIIKADILYGYYMHFEKIPYLYVMYMVINVLFIVITMNIYKSNLDKKNIVFIISSSVISILETMMFLIGYGIFTELIISDIVWILTLDYGISKLRRTGK